LYRYT
jgi:hypothetical protein